MNLVNPNSALIKHKKYLKELEAKKNAEREEAIKTLFDEEIKIQQFRE